MVIGASLLASEAMYAAPVTLNVPVHAMFSTEKPVKVGLRNNTKQAIKVKAGDAEMTLQPGAEIVMKLHSGEKVVAENGTPTVAAGTVLAVISDALNNATLVIN